MESRSWDPLRLALFTRHNSSEFHPSRRWINRLFLLAAEHYSAAWLYPSRWHLDCFQLLHLWFPAIPNTPLEPFMCRVLGKLKFSFVWDKCPGVRLLGHMTVACLVLKGTDELVLRTALSLFLRWNYILYFVTWFFSLNNMYKHLSRSIPIDLTF